VPKFSQEQWVSWLQSIEDAAHSLKRGPPCEEFFPDIMKIDQSLWTMDQDIKNMTRKEKGNGSVDMPGL
jgi:hypothetical protein